MPSIHDIPRYKIVVAQPDSIEPKLNQAYVEGYRAVLMSHSPNGELTVLMENPNAHQQRVP